MGKSKKERSQPTRGGIEVYWSSTKDGQPFRCRIQDLSCGRCCRFLALPRDAWLLIVRCCFLLSDEVDVATMNSIDWCWQPVSCWDVNIDLQATVLVLTFADWCCAIILKKSMDKFQRITTKIQIEKQRIAKISEVLKMGAPVTNDLTSPRN